MRGRRETASIEPVVTRIPATSGRYLIGCLLLGLVLGGCGASEPDPDHPDDVVLVAPRLAPPPARDGALDRDAALAVARRHADPAEAITELDAHRFAFALDAAALAWFGQQGVEPAVMDYLEKRSKVDWEALRGDVDPDSSPQ